MNTVYLSQLDKLVKKHLVIEYYERGVESMCIQEYLPLCAALLYPYRNEKFPSEIKTNGNITPIIVSIKSFTKKTKGLEKYSLDGLRKYFQYKWLPTLDFDNQKRLIKGVSLVDKVEDDGFFSIKGNEKVYDSYLYRISVLDISDNYGSETFEISNDTSVNKEEAIEDCRINDIQANNDNTPKTISLNPLVDFLVTEIPLSKYPNGLNTYDYFWQYRINAAQYEQLKQSLKELRLSDNTKLIGHNIPGYGTVARVVALYISEWYKREYNGYDSNNAFASIGIDKGKNSNLSQKIFEKLGKTVYKSKCASGRGEGNNEWLYSIYVEGGLPIKYVTTKKERFNKFVNGICKIDDGNKLTKETIDEIVGCFDERNGVFKSSLESGSCNEYLVALINYLANEDILDLPFNESDLNKPLFSEFITCLRNGYDKEFKFSPEVRIWTYDYLEEGDNSNSVESEFYVQIGRRHSNNVITQKELSNLDVHLPANTNTFTIRFQMTFKDDASKWSDTHRTYFKIGNGCDDFYGAFGSDIATVIDFYNIKEISLWLECGDYKKEIYKYVFPQYLELYSTNNYFLWTTRTNNSAKKVLFYDKDVYTPIDTELFDIQTKSKFESNWGWIYQKDNIILQDPEGKKITILVGQSELIIVDFETKELRKNVLLSRHGCVKCHIAGEYYKDVPLLYYSDRKNLSLACDGMKGQDLMTNYKIEYKPLHNNTRYTEWDNTNSMPQGFIKLRINCRDTSKKKREWVDLVYFIPAVGSIVSRNFENACISFSGKNIRPLLESISVYFESTLNRFIDNPTRDPNSPTISFRIGDNENYIVLDVYRAFKWYQLLTNNNPIITSTSSTSIPSLADIFIQKGIIIKVVNEEGFEEKKPSLNEYYDYYDNPWTISARDVDSTCWRYYKDNDGDYKRYIYLNGCKDWLGDGNNYLKIEPNGNSILLNVNDEDINKYVFYYWSGILDDAPVKLERKELDNNKKYEYLFPQILTDRAVVFQSLQDCAPYLYFRPFYAYKEGDWHFYVKKYYSSVDITYLIKCYQLAVMHNVYFCIFPALRVLQNRDTFTNFIRLFIQHKNFDIKKDWVDLTRLAKELAMDWFFVNRKILFNKLTKESVKKMRECMRSLLLHSPLEQGDYYYSKKFIDLFLQNDNIIKLCGSGLSRVFIKALNNFENYNGYDKHEDRIKLLNMIVKAQDNIFPILCKNLKLQ